ncbi:hypothetical protein RhiirA5_416536 [Rhizophagus irregularis]|uniref:Uncharacterized protein n=1 Tax=Rhizophagus irregularis TaxID=588596 RepID=A0A2N0PPK3_9GLOM|nr:hypothetical protein RhiirA5_416536 [Rhizophagus irregularis]
MSRRKRLVSALLSNDEESITARSSRKSRVISRVIDEESEESISIIHTHDRRMVPCNCSKCNGKIVDVRTKLNHEADRDSDDDQDSEVVQDYKIATEALIQFIKLLLIEIGSSNFEEFSDSLYLARNVLRLKDQYHNFAACLKCHKLYNKKEVEEFQQNGNLTVMKCSHVEFPNSTSRRLK